MLSTTLKAGQVLEKPRHSLVDLARLVVTLIDHTALDDEKSEHKARQVCCEARANGTAAVCIWPQYVPLAREELAGSRVRIATVANFPSGSSDIDPVVEEVDKAISQGTHEVDVVMPFQAWLAGDEITASALLAACHSVCRGRALLKVILESGEFRDAEALKGAARAAIREGASFLKTSTGKRKSGATPQSAKAILEVIREHWQATGRIVGFKASGGIKVIGDAQVYLDICEATLGAHWANAQTFRLGASSLLKDAIAAQTNHTSS